MYGIMISMPMKYIMYKKSILNIVNRPTVNVISVIVLRCVSSKWSISVVCTSIILALYID